MGINNRQSKLLSPLVNAVVNQGWMCGSRSRIALALATAVGVMGMIHPVAQAASSIPDQIQSVALAQADDSQPERYLFGQVAQPDQIGQGYVVLERSGDRVYGALYFPSSSFDCFSGRVQGTELAMSIYSTYDQDVYGYSLALAEGPVVATSTGQSELAPLGLSGFHAIADLSDNDHRMLNVCRSVVTR